MKIELKYNPCQDRWHGERLFFTQCNNNCWTITNSDKELLGHIEKLRCGRFMHWCLLLEKDCYLSPGCNDEVREMQRKLYSLRNS